MATWFVTGAARGLGYEIARHALEAGANVVTTARSLSQVEAAFAVEGLSEAMQAELSPLGIKVTIVEPGSFRTSFLDGGSLHTTANELPDYAATAGRVRQAVAASNGGQVNDPAKGAAAIYAAVTAVQPPLRFQVGPDAVAMVEDKLTRVRGELEAWRPLASSTLFTDTADSKSA